MTEKKKRGRPPKPQTPKPPKDSKPPKDATFDSKATRKRVAKVWLKLLSWAEGTVDKIMAGELEATVGLVDSLLKTISTTAEKLPRLQTEARTSPEAPDPTEPEEVRGWCDEDEREYLASIAESPGLANDYLSSDDNSDDMKDLLRQHMKTLADNPPTYPEAPSLKLP